MPAADVVTTNIVSATLVARDNNLAATATGGQTVSVPSNEKAKSRLIDGNLNDGWWDAQIFDPVRPVVITLGLGGDGAVAIDRVALHTRHFQGGRAPSEIEIAVSAVGPEAGFQTVGRYRLAKRKATHLARFQPVEARFVKITVLAIHESPNKARNKVALGEIMVLQAQPAPPPVAGEIAAQPRVEEKPSPPRTRLEPQPEPEQPAVAGKPPEEVPAGPVQAAGTAVLDEAAPEREAERDLARFDLGGLVEVIPGKEGTLPRDVEVSFFDGREAVLDSVVLQSRDSQWVSMAHTVELWAVGAGKETLIGKYLLHKSATPQRLSFDPFAAQTLRVRVLKAFPYRFKPNSFQFERVMALESRDTGRSILDGAVAVLDQEAPEREAERDLARAAFSGLVKLLPGEKGVLPRDVEVSFIDGREAVLDGVVLQSRDSQWVSMAHTVELWAVGAGKETLIGKYLLHKSATPQRLSFDPVAAQTLRVRVLTAFPYSFKPNSFQFERVMALETDQPGHPSLLDRVMAKAFDPRSVEPRMNIALSALGGRIEPVSEKISSQYDGNFGRQKLIDGGVQVYTDWSAGRGKMPQGIVFSFRDRRTALIDAVALDSTLGNYGAGDRPKARIALFEIQVSDAVQPENGGFRSLGKFLLPNDAGPHVVRFKPVEARFLKLLIHSTHGGNIMPGLSELMVLEAPDPTRPSIIEGLDINIAPRTMGGHIVRFSSQGGKALNLIDGKAGPEAPAWTSRERDDRKATDNQWIVFGFVYGRDASIRKIVVDPRSEADADTRVAEFKVLISPSGRFSDFAEAEFTEPQPIRLGMGDGPRTLTLKAAARARFVMIRITGNHGGGVFSLGEVGIVLDRPNDIVAQQTAADDDGIADAPPGAGEQAACAGVCEREPNDTPETATPLTPGETMAGVLDAGDKDHFLFAPEDKSFNVINIHLESQPYIRSAVELLDMTGKTVKKLGAEHLSGQQARFSWAVPGGAYRIKLSEPRTKVALVFDNSGSMSGSVGALKTALKEYVRSAPPYEDILLIGFDSGVDPYPVAGADEAIRNKCARPGDLRHEQCVNLELIEKQVTASGGTDLYNSIVQAHKELGSKGNRTIILMTDGQDTGSLGPVPAWDILAGDPVRVFTIGLGSGLHGFIGDLGSSPTDFLRNVSIGTGGRYQFAPTADRLAELYRIIRQDIGETPRYRITATPATGHGTLRVVETGEKVVAPNPAAIDLVVDLSGSMGWCLDADVRCPGHLNRIATARRALDRVLREIPATIPIAVRAFGLSPRRGLRDVDAICSETTQPVQGMAMAPLTEDYRSRLLAWVGGLDWSRGATRTAIGRTLGKVPGDFPPDAKDRKVILITDGDDDCDALDSPDYPLAVIDRLKAQGFDVRIDVVGFAITEKKTMRLLRDVARLGGGTYYDAKDGERLASALRQSFNAPVVVRDRGGDEIARGAVGGPAIEVPTGIYRVEIETQGKTEIEENVEIRDQRTTVLELKKDGSDIDLSRPRITAYEPPGAAEPPPPPAAAAPRADPVRALLDRARQYLDANRLMTPPGANAYEVLRDVLRLEPENAEAKTALARIAGKYESFARRALARGDLKAATKYGDRGLKVAPGHGGLMAARAEVVRERAERARRRQAELAARARKEQEGADGRRRQEESRREALAIIDEAVLGPGISARSKAMLNIDDMIAIAKAYTAALEIVPDGETMRWDNAESGNSGGIIPRSTFRNDQGRPCRVYGQFMSIAGKSERAPDTIACKRANGEWHRPAP